VGLFPNYDKVGPGVDKNAPKKRGIFLYFELLGRYFLKFVKANMLYVLCSLPMLLFYHFIFFCIFAAKYGNGAEQGAVNQIAITMTVLLVTLWGTGPVSCGLTSVFRSIAREEHAWVGLDFFKKSKESFKHGLAFLLVDIVVFMISFMAFSVYSEYISKNGLFIVPMLILIVGLIIYTFMHFFMYEFEITFENKVKEIYKNSFIMTLATLPMCIIIGAIVGLLTYVILGSLPNSLIVILSFLIWVGVMRFIIDFYSARIIKRRFLNNSPKESEK